MRDVSKKVVEKIKIILHSITFFQKLCYEMMWPRQVTNDNIIQHMYFAFQITKATESHSEYVILIAFPCL